jgi:hypothetical protein
MFDPNANQRKIHASAIAMQLGLTPNRKKTKYVSAKNTTITTLLESARRSANSIPPSRIKAQF